MDINFKRILLILFIFLGAVGVVGLLCRNFFNYKVNSVPTNFSIKSLITANKLTSFEQIHHVFVIVEENHDWQSIYKNPNAPFINNTLLAQGAFAQNYYNLPKNMNALHPSEPNYIMLEAGKFTFSDHEFTTDGFPSSRNITNSTEHLSSLLEKNHLSWTSYQEDISGSVCPISSVNNYAPKHNPFIFFQDISGNPPSGNNSYCIQHIRPFSELQQSLDSGNVTNYTFITPNQLHDMHDGTIAEADTWLAATATMIMGSETFKKDGALFVVWDEGGESTGANTPIGMIMMSPFVKAGYTNSIDYSHASYVKTIEEIFKLSPLLGMAADPATLSLSDFFK